MTFIIPKDENLSVDIAATATAEIFRETCPSKAKIFITHFGNYINEFDAWGLIVWTFKKNGAPIHPYDEIKDQLGWGAMLRELAPVEISGGDIFTIEIKNNYADVVKCGVALKWEIHEGE